MCCPCFRPKPAEVKPSAIFYPTVEEMTRQSPSRWVMNPLCPTESGYYLVKAGTEKHFREITAYWNGRFWVQRSPSSPEMPLFDVLCFMPSGITQVIVRPGVGIDAEVFRDPEALSKDAIKAAELAGTIIVPRS